MVPVDYFVLHQKLGPAITRFCLPVCRKYHINQTCFDVLMFLANNGEEYNTARDLCAVRGIKPGLASVAVETLIQRGYLARAGRPGRPAGPPAVRHRSRRAAGGRRPGLPAGVFPCTDPGHPGGRAAGLQTHRGKAAAQHP